MSYPKTKEDWWKIANENDNNIYEMMCMVVGKRGMDGKSGFTSNHIVEYREAKEKTDVRRMIEILNNVWWLMPESVCRGLPGWFSLCDLCSEGPSIFEEYWEE